MSRNVLPPLGGRQPHHGRQHDRPRDAEKVPGKKDYPSARDSNATFKKHDHISGACYHWRAFPPEPIPARADDSTTRSRLTLRLVIVVVVTVVRLIVIVPSPTELQVIQDATENVRPSLTQDLCR